MRPSFVRRFLLPLVGITAAIGIACSAGAGTAGPASAPNTGDASAPGESTQAETKFTANQPEPSQDGGRGNAPAEEPGFTSPEQVVEAQNQLLGDLFERVLPSMVEISVAIKVDSLQSEDVPFGFGPRDDSFRPSGGSGFVWDEEGHVITNYHVVTDAEAVRVTFPDGTQVAAEVLGTDPDTDLAVLQVDRPVSELHPVQLGDSDKVRVGELAVAIGNPFGEEFSMTTGIISAVGRTIRSPQQVGYSIPNAIQMDAAVNPGNSGGVLLDYEGRVIGINDQIQTRSGAFSGVGFAIPINAAKRVVPELIEARKYDHAWLGVSIESVNFDIIDLMDLDPSTKGALIVSVVDGGPADAAGLQGFDTEVTRLGRQYRTGGDIITGIDGTPLKSVNDLIGYLSTSARPGDEIALDVIRDGESIEVELELGKRPESANG